uniref:Glyoxysomal processing protease, glyoxysomal n=1 Tax=Auxenochlorella protothecoides TaxID=3075 RepID=A0A1D1ZXN0_AUXPR
MILPKHITPRIRARLAAPHLPAAGGQPFEARLLAVRGLHAVHAALTRLTAAPCTHAGGWLAGWDSRLGPAAAAAATCTLAVLAPAGEAGAAALEAVSPGAGKGGCGSAPAMQLGAGIFAVGAPFGTVAPAHFQFLLARGMLSGSVPDCSRLPQPVLWLSDLVCLPGLEGSPVHAAAATDAAATPTGPLGVLLGPLAPRSGGGGAVATLLVPMACVLEAVRDLENQGVAGVAGLSAEAGRGTPSFVGPYSPETPSTSKLPASPAPPAAAAAGRSVVAVKARGGWASGVLVSHRGHILTVAHLFADPGGGAGGRGGGEPKPLPTPRAAWVAWAPDPGRPPRWLPARVLHVFRGPMDLAVLQVERGVLPRRAAPAAPAGDAALARAAGRDVVVAGYPTFDPAASGLSGPVLTAGTLSKVVALRGRPAMLLTSASVRSGASGGGLLDRDSGALLGLVTSNARHVLGTTYPHLNFCIPASLLRPTLAALLEERSAGPDWAALDAPDPALSRVWRLGSREAPDKQGLEPPAPRALQELLAEQQGEGGGAGKARPRL